MSANTSIEWADHTFNPWIGCTKISPACDNCYAAVSTPARTKGVVWGAGQARQRTAPSTWEQPKKWERAHKAFFAEHGRRQRVFCASLADVFDNEVDPLWRADLFALIAATPNIDWLVLTKRVGNAFNMVSQAYFALRNWDNRNMSRWPWQNVWLGVTICNQEEADRDIPKLLKIPAVKRFLSIEPLLGPLDITKHIDYCEKLDKSGISRRVGGEHIACDAYCGISWVIVGGESGANARPMHPDWARGVQAQCTDAGVPFLFKQWGEWFPRSAWEDNPELSLPDDSDVCESGSCKIFDDEVMHRVGKKHSGRSLDGAEWNEFPA